MSSGTTLVLVTRSTLAARWRPRGSAALGRIVDATRDGGEDAMSVGADKRSRQPRGNLAHGLRLPLRFAARAARRLARILLPCSSPALRSA
jgi:hypothetical protein